MKNEKDSEHSDEFWLYDLRVEVVEGVKSFVCNHKVGDYFLVEGENLIFKESQIFPIPTSHFWPFFIKPTKI